MGREVRSHGARPVHGIATAKRVVDAEAAIDRLRRGNLRFAKEGSRGIFGSLQQREALVAGQSPFAIILSCSDSRVPAELVFDCGLGDLFVVRVAGNVVDPALVGSIEFAVTTFGTQLVVVMGHTNCGAVAAAWDAMTGEAPSSPNVRDLVDRIAPSVRTVCAGRAHPGRDLLPQAIRANVRASVDALLRGSEILRARAATAELVVVPAEYSLETGYVAFLDPASAQLGGAQVDTPAPTISCGNMLTTTSDAIVDGE